MEPGVIPSFTFPSRHDKVNYSKGWKHWSTVNETVMVKPAKNTDINLESGLEDPLIQPPNVDKYSLTYKGVLPASTNLYVQPGRAEGVTELAKLMNSEVGISALTSANNALRRGNKVAAEFILGRELTTEEAANQTVTPIVRKGENGEARHVPMTNNSIGSLVAAEGANNHHRNEMLKQVEKGVINDMAAHLGIPVPLMRHYKTIMGFTGDSILGWKAFTPAEKDVLLKDLRKHLEQVKKNEIEMKAPPPPSIIHGQNQPIHSGAEAEIEANIYRRTRREFDQESASWQNDTERQQDMALGFDDDDAFEEDNEFRGKSDNVAERLAERRAGGPPDTNTGDFILNDQGVYATQEFIRNQDIPAATALDHEPGRRKELQPAPVPDALAALVDREEKRELRDAEIIAVQAEHQSFQRINEQKQSSDEVEMRQVAPAEEKHDEDMNEDTEAINQLKSMGLIGGGLRPRRTMKRKRLEHHGQGIGDRWVPDTDSIRPEGGVASGRLMKATGRNAIPISAQIQVANHHQWDETPLQQWVRNPNFTQVDKTYHSDIPVPQYSGPGVGRRSKKVRLGGYMVDHNKLLSSNVLSLSYPTGRKVKGFPNQEVSNAMKNAVHNIVTGGSVNMKPLKAHEKMTLHHILSKSAANVTGADINVSPSEQLKLAMGEIEAGNDSPALKQQIKKLLPILRRSNLITAGQVQDISKHYL